MLTQQIAVPVLVPHNIQDVFTEVIQNSQNLPPHFVNATYLENLDNSSTGDTATGPSTFSPIIDEPSWRLWVVDKYTMWAGQRRTFDGITELMKSSFYLFKASKCTPRMDLDLTKLQLARSFRRRVVLPEVSDYTSLQTALNSGSISQRESALFRLWVSQVAYRDNVHHASTVGFNSAILDKKCWQDGDEGTWDDVGAPTWTDTEGVETSDVTVSLAGLTVDMAEGDV